MAGQAFHVHALDSTFNSGAEVDAQFEWNFGDAGGKYNNLMGYNAAHVYDSAGTYTITLKITNKDGKSASKTLTVNVAADTRRTIYVDPSGNDAATGLSPTDAVRTVARANQLIDNNTKVLFKRDGTYDITSAAGGFYITKSNVVIGAYGTGDAPVIRRSGTVDGGTMIAFNDAIHDFMVQDLNFTSVITKDNSQVNRPIVMSARGTNISMRNCVVHNIGYMVTTVGGPKGTLVQDNTSPDVTGMSGYMVWMEAATSSSSAIRP